MTHDELLLPILYKTAEYKFTRWLLDTLDIFGVCVCVSYSLSLAQITVL